MARCSHGKTNHVGFYLPVLPPAAIKLGSLAENDHPIDKKNERKDIITVDQPVHLVSFGKLKAITKRSRQISAVPLVINTTGTLGQFPVLGSCRITKLGP